jgi:photosystem II stability/assembly factor-like uncharacterized protein
MRLLPLVLVVGALAGCRGSWQQAVQPMPGTVPSTAPDRAIADVLSSLQGAGFGFFPNHDGREPCVIPEGGPVPRPRVEGICMTRVVPRLGYSGQTVVAFTQIWPWTLFHRAGAPRRPQTHSWTFVVLPSRKVTLLRQGGDFPPQWVMAAALARPAPVILRWLQMIDAVHGYALSGQDPDKYRLLRTSDGGRFWTDVTPGGGTVHPSGPITILGGTMLFSTTLRPGVFAVERSDDGGRTWRRSLPFRDRGGVGQPFAVDTRHLYLAVNEGAAAGSQGQALFTSSDGGHSWRFVSRTTVSGRPGTLPFGCDKDGFGFATPSLAFAGGYCAGGAPFLYRTDDGGRSWRRQRLAGVSLCGCDTSAPRFFTPQDGAFSVSGFTENGGDKPLVRVYWTDDAGDHWRASVPPAGRASSIGFTDARTAWVVATPPGRIRPPFDRLARTSDGGGHWQAVKLPFDAEYYRLDAVSATLAYAFDYADGGSSILRTEDGGRTWQKISAVGARSS